MTITEAGAALCDAFAAHRLLLLLACRFSPPSYLCSMRCRRARRHHHYHIIAARLEFLALTLRPRHLDAGRDGRARLQHVSDACLIAYVLRSHAFDMRCSDLK